jgi:DNA-binding MarR family transcriptional regulator
MVKEAATVGKMRGFTSTLCSPRPLGYGIAQTPCQPTCPGESSAGRTRRPRLDQLGPPLYFEPTHQSPTDKERNRPPRHALGPTRCWARDKSTSQTVPIIDCLEVVLYDPNVETDQRQAADDVLPVLLKPGRGVYGYFIRDALAEAGFSDMPANGGYVLGLLEPSGSAALSDVISDLGVSKQTASQLIDTLVVRGYLDRSVDPEDRRRVLLTLTERGRAASDVVYATAQNIDARLVAIVGAERLLHTKETLAALLSLRTAASHQAAGDD